MNARRIYLLACFVYALSASVIAADLRTASIIGTTRDTFTGKLTDLFSPSYLGLPGATRTPLEHVQLFKAPVPDTVLLPFTSSAALKVAVPASSTRSTEFDKPLRIVETSSRSNTVYRLLPMRTSLKF